MRITPLLLSAALLLLVACGDTASSTASSETTPEPAAAPEKETSASGEWIPLFNGEDFTGWHTYGKEGVGAAWKIDDGAIHLDVANKDGWQAEGGGDIVTDKAYAVKPVGEWNKVKLVVTDGKVEHWLNGKKQVEYVNKGPEWKTMIANSKFKEFDAFGQSTSGKISLQDHGDAVWYRNIRIRELGS